MQSATGFGFALVVAPALLALVDPAEAVTTVCFFAVAVNVLMLLAERRTKAVRGADVALILVSAIPGLAVGVLVLETVDREGLQVVVGLAVIAATAVRMLIPPVPEHEPSPGPQRLGGVVAGILAGVLTTSTSVNGPPPFLWLVRHCETSDEVRDSLALIFIGLNLAGAAVIALTVDGAGLVGPGVIALGVPAVVVGWMAGRYAFERMGPRAFLAASYAVALAAGAASLAAGVL